MPRYQITDSNTGRTLVIEGDSPPTDDEAEQLFASAPKPVEAPKPGIMSRIGSALGFGDKESGQNLSDLVTGSQGAAAQAPAPIGKETVDALVSTIQRSSPYPLPDWVARSVLTRGGAIGDTAAQVIPAIGGTMVGATGGPGGAAFGGAVGAGAGNTLAQVRRNIRGEQQGINPGEALANMAAGAVPMGNLKAGMGIGKALIARGTQGGMLGAAQEGVRQTIDEEKYDWGKIGQHGALGVGLGLVLGVPEAIALRKALGGSAPLEGKTLKDAVETIAAETQIPPQSVADRINDMVGVGQRQGDAAQQSAEVFQKQVTAKSAQDSAEAILAGEALRKSREEAFTLAKAEEAIQQAKTQGIAGAPEIRGASQPVRNAPMPPNRGPMLSPQAQRMADEYGGVNPALLMPVASAAMGGVIGGATGDTPEERVQNALIGAGIGATPFGVAKLVQAVKNTPVGDDIAHAAGMAWKRLKLLENKRAFMPKELRDQLRVGEAQAAATEYAGQRLVKDLDSAIQGTGNVAAQGVNTVTVREFLDGKISLAQVPEPIRVEAEKVRGFMDNMADRAVKEGVVEGELATTMIANKGSYMRRSYEAFINPRFRFDPKLKEEAIKATQANGKLTRTEAEIAIAEVMDIEKASNFLSGAKVGGRDVSSLIKRQDLLPEVKALLGEIHDPIIAASQTIPRLARLVEMHHNQEKLKEIGLRLGHFSRSKTPEHIRQFTADDSQTHPWLVGLWASPDSAEAWRKEFASGRTDSLKDIIFSSWMTTTSAAKVAKTVLNPESYSTNLIGGIVSNALNGNFRASSVARGLVLGAEELGLIRKAFPRAPLREELAEELKDLRRLEVIGESVIGRDLNRTITQSYWEKVHNPVIRPVRVLSKLYGGIDDLTRYAFFKAEQAKYTAALPNATQEQIKQIAAGVTRMNAQTYSEVPEILKQLSNWGFSPQFVNQQYEVFRNAFNTVRVGLRDIKAGNETGNAALRNVGIKRLASFGAVTVASGSFGVSLLSRMENGIDDEQEKAVRYFLAPWDRDASLMFHSKIERGKPISYSNLSYVAPPAALWSAFEAGKRGEDEGTAVGSFVKSLFSQWLGSPVDNSMVAGALVSQLTGRDAQTGRQINIDKSDTEPTQADRLRYNFDKVWKPALINFGEKVQKAAAGEVGPYGKVYSLEEQRNRLLGVRQSSTLPEQAVRFKANELAHRINGAEGMYRNRVTQGKTPEQQAQDYQDAEAKRQELFNEMRRAAAYAEKIHVTRDEFAAALSAAKVDSTLIAGVLDGIYTPMARDKNEPASAIADALYGKPEEQQMAELAKLHMADPFRAKDVVTSLRGMRRNDALKITFYDKILMKMGKGNGELARYLNRKRASLKTTAERKAFDDEMIAKGIITREVMYQMQNPK